VPLVHGHEAMSEPHLPLAASQSQPWAIAVDVTSVYWTNQMGGTVTKVGK
jgi:hypothetical protein